MDPRFDNYGRKVCQFIPYATGREKAGIQAELSAHLEDHAQALLEAGYEDTHAHQAALDAMGDPMEVGRALAEAYPLRWLILSRAVLLPLVLAALLVFGTLLSNSLGVYDNLQARFAPLSAEGAAPADIRLSLPNGDVIRVYAAGLTWQDDNGYTGYVAQVYSTSYNENPFRAPLFSALYLDYTTQDPSNDLFVADTGSRQDIYNIQKNDTLFLSFEQYGTTYHVEIPLPWEEVTAP